MLAHRIEVAAPAAHEAVEDRFSVTFRPAMTRREAEVMFEIDASHADENPGWTAYFVESLTEFMVFGERPTGRISERDAAWLASCVGETVSPGVRPLLRALILQSENAPETLVALAMRCGAMRERGASLV